MARFFVDRLPEAGSLYELTGENAAHAKVLRLRPGEAVTLCDGRGADCPCTVTEGLTLLAGPALPCPAEPRVRVTVWLAFPKADKAEHVIQKAVELGAAELVLFPSRWCVSRPEGKALEKKLERWQKIARSAAEQSRRGVIPAVRAADSFSEALKEAAAAELPILFYENAAGYSLHDALADLGALRTVEAPAELGALRTVEAPPHPSPAATPSPQGEGFAHDALAELGASRTVEALAEHGALRTVEAPPHPSPAATPSPQGEGFAHDALADLGASRIVEAPPHPSPAATPSPQGEGFAHDAPAELGALCTVEAPPHPSPAATPSPQGEGFAHDALAELGASRTVEAPAELGALRTGEAPPHPSPAATPSPQGEGFAHDALAEHGALRTVEAPPHPSPAATPSPQGEGFAHDALADLGASRIVEAPPHPLPAAVQAARISLMTGSEGGFSEEEIGKAEAAGMKICTLGPRILRCETAPLAALTAVMYALGEM